MSKTFKDLAVAAKLAEAAYRDEFTPSLPLTARLGSGWTPHYPAEGTIVDGFYEERVWLAAGLTTVSAYLAFDDAGTATIAIRGSRSWKQAFAVPLYQDIFWEEIDHVIEAFVGFIAERDDAVERIIVTGHSLGGTLAEKALRDFEDELRAIDAERLLITFGSYGDGTDVASDLADEIIHFGHTGDRIFLLGERHRGGTDVNVDLPGVTAFNAEHQMHLYERVFATVDADLMAAGPAVRAIADSWLQNLLAAGQPPRFVVDVPAVAAGASGPPREMVSDGGRAYLLAGLGGNDTLRGSWGDVLLGGVGHDVIHGGERSLLSGGEGNDVLSAGVGSYVDGGAGLRDSADVWSGDEGANLVFDPREGLVNRLSGGTSVVNVETLRVHLGTGDDRIGFTDIRAGQHEVHDGGGHDTLAVDWSRLGTAVTVEAGRPGLLTARSAGDAYRMITTGMERVEVRGGRGNDSMSAGERTAVFEGGVGNDTLTGHSGADTLRGGANDDTIEGGGGADLLDGGTGNDLLGGSPGSRVDGGAGTDTLNGYNFGSEALDLVFDPREGVVNRLVGGATAVNVEVLNLWLGSGDDRIGFTDARPGQHNVYDHGGWDTLTVDWSRLTEAVTAELWVRWPQKDILIRSASGSHGVSGYALDRVEIKSGRGNDVLQAGDFVAVFDGGGGDDVLHGAGWYDTLRGGAGNDDIVGAYGHDLLAGGPGVDRVHFDSRYGLGARLGYDAPNEGGDVVHGFVAGYHRVEVRSAGFGGLPVGDLASSHFVSNLTGRASAAVAQFTYETDTRMLRWDGDGTGPVRPVVLATFQADVTLTHADFVVVA